MRKRSLAGAMASAIAMACLVSGCSPKSSGKPLTASEKELMSQPVGTVRMPPEAAEAMKRGRSGPPAGPPAGANR